MSLYSQSRSRQASVCPSSRRNAPDPNACSFSPSRPGGKRTGSRRAEIRPFNIAHPFHVTATETNRATPSPCVIPTRRRRRARFQPDAVAVRDSNPTAGPHQTEGIIMWKFVLSKAPFVPEKGKKAYFVPQPSATIKGGVLHLECHAAGAAVTVTRGRPAVGSTRRNVSRRGRSAPWLPTRPGTSAAARSEAGRGRREGGFPRRLPKCALKRQLCLPP